MPVQATRQPQSTAANGPYPDVERIYHDWDKALANNDAAALLALYARDATLESPLVAHLMGTETGVCRGRRWSLDAADAARPLRRADRGRTLLVLSRGTASSIV